MTKDVETIKQLVYCNNILYTQSCNKCRIFSFICQHASRHQPHKSAQFPVHQPALLPAMTPAANRDTNRSTTQHHQLQFRPCAPIAVPAPVHLPAAPRLAATPCTTRLLTRMANAITHQGQQRDQRNTTSSTNVTGRIKGKLGMERNQRRWRAKRFSLLFSFINIWSTFCVQNSSYIAQLPCKKRKKENYQERPLRAGYL